MIPPSCKTTFYVMVGIRFSEDHYKSGYERRPIDVSYVAAILKMPLFSVHLFSILASYKWYSLPYTVSLSLRLFVDGLVLNLTTVN